MDKTILVFRYDDYHAKRGTRDTTKTCIEKEFFGIFEKNRIPLSVGVVPNVVSAYENLESKEYYLLSDDKERLNLMSNLVKKGIVEVALHGWNHQAQKGSREDSEFCGLSYSDQLSRIMRGKKLLEDWFEVPIISFIPPWNRYNNITTQVLLESGINAVSCSPNGPFVENGLKYIPQICSLENIQNALSMAARCSGIKIIVIMFHHFSFFESDSPLMPRYANLSLKNLQAVISQILNQPDTEVLTIGQIASDYASELQSNRLIEAVRYWQFASIHRKTRFLWRYFERSAEPKVFFPRSYYWKRNLILKFTSKLVNAGREIKAVKSRRVLKKLL